MAASLMPRSGTGQEVAAIMQPGTGAGDVVAEAGAETAAEVLSGTRTMLCLAVILETGAEAASEAGSRVGAGTEAESGSGPGANAEGTRTGCGCRCWRSSRDRN